MIAHDNVKAHHVEEPQQEAVGVEEEEVDVGRSARCRKLALWSVLITALVFVTGVVAYFVAVEIVPVTVVTKTDINVVLITSGGSPVRVELTNTEAGETNVVHVWITFSGDREIEYVLDMVEETYSLIGNNVVLTAADIEALKEVVQFEADNAQTDDSQQTWNDHVIEKVLDYLSMAPLGEPLPDIHKSLDMSSPNRRALSVTSIPWGQPGTAHFDSSGYFSGWSWVSGSTYSQTVDVGNPASNCLGRCGAGCSTWDFCAYQDCLNHDRCVGYLGGSVFAWNYDCGDEFASASDDYAYSLVATC